MCPFSVPDQLDLRRNALLGMADAVCLRHSRDELLAQLIALLEPILSIDLLTFALADPQQEIMKIEFWEGPRRLPRVIEVTVAFAAAGEVWRSQSAICIENLAKERRFEAESKSLRERGMRSYCALPLTSSGLKLGAIGFARKRRHSWSDEDVDFLRFMAGLIAISADSVQTESEVTEEIGKLRLMIDLWWTESRFFDWKQVTAEIVGTMQKWAAEDSVGIYIYDEITGSLRLEMLDRKLAGKMAPEGGLTPLEGTLAGQVFRSRHSMVLDYASLTGLSLDSVKRGLEMGVRALYLCPLLAGNTAVGVLKVARRQERGFAAREIEFMARVATKVARILSESLSHKGSEPDEHQSKPIAGKKAVETAMAGAKPPQPGLEGSPESRVARLFGTAEALIGSKDLLSAAGVGVGILDLNLHYVIVNEALAAINALPAAEHIGKSLREVAGDLAPLAEPYLQRVVTTGRPVADLELSAMLPRRSEPGHWSIYYVPIKDDAGKVVQIGAVIIETTEQKKLESSLHRISESLRQERKRQAILSEITRVLATNWNVAEVFSQISAKLRRLLRQEYAALAVRDEKSERLVRRAVDFPMGKNGEIAGEIGVAESVGGRALQRRAPMIFDRDEVREFDPALAADMTSEGLKSLCCVPLIRLTKPLGVLVLGSTRPGAFHSEDFTLLDQVAAQLAMALEDAQALREVEALKKGLKQENRYLKLQPARGEFNDIVGQSAGLGQVLNEVAMIAATDATVLVLGETGTGKGLIAQEIHRISKRNGRGFVTLNCAAIPTGLLESELFGHEKGAFTGAVKQKIGRLELAHGGTLFLDEIGEIPLEVQPKLLRVLQDREFERLGGKETIRSDFRLIAATNRDLAKSVLEKQFRSDLYYRLNVFPIRLPSLRERREDIPLLVRDFVQKYSHSMGREIGTIPSETMEILMRWDWPGNVRELQNFIERSVILTQGSALYAPLEELQRENRSGEQSLEVTERQHILRVLRETRGLISGPGGAARRLGLKRTTLQSKMQRLGITREEYAEKKTG
jgi:formate hydrogenlyase transcriptional activator